MQINNKFTIYYTAMAVKIHLLPNIPKSDKLDVQLHYYFITIVHNTICFTV